MTEQLTFRKMAEALAYAAISQQLEIVDETVAVYFDQLQKCDPVDLVKAVKKWVATYDGEFSRLPKVSELRGLMREGKAQIDPQVADEMKLAAVVRAARLKGLNEEEVQAIIDEFDRLRLG